MSAKEELRNISNQATQIAVKVRGILSILESNKDFTIESRRNVIDLLKCGDRLDRVLALLDEIVGDVAFTELFYRAGLDDLISELEEEGDDEAF